MSELIKYAEDIIAKFGSNGDNSFEYIGINIDDNVSYKVYRKAKGCAVNYLKNEKPYSNILDVFNDAFLKENMISICDFSKGTYEDKETHRVIFSLKKIKNKASAVSIVGKILDKLGTDDYVEKILNSLSAVQKSIDCEDSLLLQMGVEMDKECNLVGVKYYIATKDLNSIHSDKEKVRRLCSNLVKENDMINFFSTHDYEPVFFGFNLYKNEQEIKLYFCSTAFGFNTGNVVSNTNAILKKYDIQSFVTENDIVSLYDKNLYVRGIAVDLNASGKWRLYINALPRKKI